MTAGDPAPARPSRRLWPVSAGVALAVLVLDQLTKSWAVSHLDDRTVHVIWTLQLNLTFNSGMAFSQGEGLGPVIAVLALGIVVFLLLSLRQTGSVLSAVAVGLVLGGAVGNLTDRLFRSGGEGFLQGAVGDFIDFQWWPIFNVADIGVTVGGALLVITSLRAGREAAHAGAADA